MTLAGLGPRTGSARRALAALAGRSFNFDLGRLDEQVLGGGWNVDELRQPLPSEPPGPPVPGGPWEQARRVMIDYQAADPAMVRATYDAERPMAGRDMLLELRFLFLRLRAGVRVGEVYEHDRPVGGRTVRVSGWNYRTLAGHFEQGEMAYEVWKWHDSGVVEFHIRAVSKAAESGNLFFRLGFRLVGRPVQLRFYRNTCARMARMVQARLDSGARRAAT